MHINIHECLYQKYNEVNKKSSILWSKTTTFSPRFHLIHTNPSRKQHLTFRVYISSITFIARLMHSIIQNFRLKSTLYKSLKDTKLKN